MRLHSNASRRSARLVLGMTMTAAVALALAACSSSSSTATSPTAAAPAATSTTASAPTTTSAAAPAATGLTGTWSGQYSGAYQGTFKLTWRQSGSRLSGTIQLSNPPDTLGIHGSVQGGSIRFGTVGGTAITYTGTVSGNSMSGNYQVQTGNGTVGGPWSASKS